MSTVLKVSEAASMGLHAMVLLAAEKEHLLSTQEIATKLGVSAAHLSKVLQRLHKAGMVVSTRGPGGGFELAPGADEMPLLNIYEAIEGALRPSECLLHTSLCGGKNCIFGSLLGSLNQQVREYLTKSTLKDAAEVYRNNGSNLQ